MRLVVQQIAHRGAPHTTVRLEEGDRFGIVGHQRARLRGAPHGGEHEARVVGLCVVIESRRPETPFAQPGL